MMSWGENVIVNVWQAGPDAPTQVRIHSALAFGLVDWGRNRKNVEKIVATMNGMRGGPAQPMPPTYS